MILDKYYQHYFSPLPWTQPSLKHQVKIHHQHYTCKHMGISLYVKSVPDSCTHSLPNKSGLLQKPSQESRNLLLVRYEADTPQGCAGSFVLWQMEQFPTLSPDPKPTWIVMSFLDTKEGGTQKLRFHTKIFRLSSRNAGRGLQFNLVTGICYLLKHKLWSFQWID